MSDDEIEQLFNTVSIDQMTSETPRFEHSPLRKQSKEGKSDVITNLRDPQNYICYLN